MKLRVPAKPAWFAAGILAVMLWSVSQVRAAADTYVPFDGEKSAWHDGFERYDYLMDEAALSITPFKAPDGEKFGIKDPEKGQRRCVVIVPKQAAPGQPWSWRGCYWDHQPQTEVELLRRGFHIAYISASATLKPGREWDAWYEFLTEKHGLSKKPAFIGMSRGGEYAYTWATAHPDRVACIYADNPGSNREALSKLASLADNDVPLLHVCGSIDPLLGKVSSVIESGYQQLGGRISVMIKDGAAHHPHSLRNPKPIADFITQSITTGAAVSVSPDYLGSKVARSAFYSIANDSREFPGEGTSITCRGPFFTECYDRFSFELAGVEGAINVITPKTAAAGKPWVFRAGFAGRDAAVDLALLAKGFHIVTGPISYNADGPILAHWNAVYQHLIDHGFSKKPVMEGAGRAAGEMLGWAVENPEKTGFFYGENPVLRCFMSKLPLLDSLAPLAKAGVSMLSVCSNPGPALDENTRALENRYLALGASITVLLRDSAKHDPLGSREAQRVADFIVERAPLAASEGPDGGRYVKVNYPASTAADELQIAVTYRLWIPDGAAKLRGIIVHQHGAGTTASIEGSTAAYDLHWQTLAKKWDCALLGPSYHVQNEKVDLSPGASELWFDPRHGSEKTFLRALRDLAAQSGHAEIETIPWALWGHSGGGIWSDVMAALHSERVLAIWMRSGTALMFLSHPEFTRPEFPAEYYTIPMMTNPGVKEKPKLSAPDPDTRTEANKMKGPWLGSLATFREVRAKGGMIGLAPDPRTGHECGDSRYLAIPFLDACLAMRLPGKESSDQKIKPMDTSKAWLAVVPGDEAVPAAEFKGSAEEAVWLPNEAVAKAWMEYVKTGAVGDMTPPLAPSNVRVTFKSEGVEIKWSAAPDFESSIAGFIVLRDGVELAKVPEKPIGKFGRPLFQSMTYHDTPSQPLPSMRYLDASAKPGDKHAYTIITVNSAGLNSEPSGAAE